MKYIRGIWRLPERFTLAFDEDLIATPKTKTIFEETLTATWRGCTGLEWTENDFGVRTIRLVASSEDPTNNNLYLLGITDDGEEEYWRYDYYHEAPIENNSVMLRNCVANDGASTFLFGLEPQEVSDEFYNWWTTHAIEVPNMSVDLNKYNLSGDTHTVVIKTLDANGNVIAASNEITWEKAAVIPEGWDYMISTAAGEEIWFGAGDTFPPLPTNSNEYHQCSDGIMTYGYTAESGSWDTWDTMGIGNDYAFLVSINGAPVSTISITTHIGGGLGEMEEIPNMSTSLTRATHVTIPKTVTTIETWAFCTYSQLANITFTGTMEQWNNISFGDLWNYHCPVITVTCTDGTITVPKYSA